MAEKIKLGSNGNFGVKEGGTLAYNDENGVFKAIELASSRASGATYVAESGLIADAEVGVPRIDWTNGVGELLLEPQRRNLISYSQDFTQWAVNNTPTTSQVFNSLTGQNNASLLGDDDAAAFERIEEFVATTIGQPYSFSVFVKKKASAVSSYSGFQISVTNKFIIFDSFNGTYNVATGNDYDSIEVVDFNTDWWKVNVVLTADATSTRVAFYGAISSNGTTIDATATGSETFFGVQLEDVSAGVGADYPTSYIRTEGSAVTRIADAVSGNSSLGQVINSSEGVLYFEGSGLANDSTNRYITLNDGSSNNRVSFLLGANTNQIRSVVYDGTTEYDYSDYSAGSLSNFKFALKYKASDFAVWINGSELDSQLSGATFSANTLSSISFDLGNGTLPFYGRIRDLRVYDTALTDAELTTLTTI